MNMMEFYQIFDQKMIELMQIENVTASDVWAGSQIRPIPRALPATPFRMPDNSLALITGDPFFWAERLDHQQGYDNAYGVRGTCAHTSISNLCKMAGNPLQEPDVVNYAISHGLSARTDGATTIGSQLKILQHYGIAAHCEFNITAGCGRIAECIEGGLGVICGLNAGIFQNRPDKIRHSDTGMITANHSVCMTGTVRDPDTGALKGFYLCDSSHGVSYAGMVFASLDMMKACYETMAESFIIVTNARIR